LPANDLLLTREKGHTDYKIGCRTGTDIEECLLYLCIAVIKMFEDEVNVDMV
jgi:hypothetical protein